MDRWDDARLFLEVARAGSFTAAAQALEVEQSTVSRRIAGLERALGSRLFDRTPSGLRPTALAQRLVERAEGIEALVHRFVDEAAAEDRAVEGKVRIALTEDLARYVVVPRVLPWLREHHPGIRPELLVSYASADLLHREADLALRFFAPRAEQLDAERIARLPTAILGQRDYVRGRKRVAAAFDWVGLGAGGVGAPEAGWYARHVGVEPRLTTDSFTAQIEMVRAGLGVALLTRSLLQADASLVELELGLPPGPALELYLVSHRAVRELPRVAVVIEALRAALAPLSGERKRRVSPRRG